MAFSITHVYEDDRKGRARDRGFVRADIEYSGVGQVRRGLYDRLKTDAQSRKEFNQLRGQIPDLSRPKL
jgi:hypothetical protein